VQELARVEANGRETVVDTPEVDHSAASGAFDEQLAPVDPARQRWELLQRLVGVDHGG
jgi:hypothetical protein